MTVKEIGIIVHGATGRIGATQHLANALAPIRAHGGIGSGVDRIMPRLLLVGRNAARLEEIARRCDNAEWTTDVNAALAKPGYSIFFDAAATEQRVATLTNAIAAGKHIYTEKPVAPTVAEGLALLRAAKATTRLSQIGRPGAKSTAMLLSIIKSAASVQADVMM